MTKIKHIPYEISPETNKCEYYETVWKEVALDLLGTHVPCLKGLSLLDFGSGRGETLQMAKDRGMSVCGTDLDPECVRLSGNFGPSLLLNSDDPVGQFGVRSFDVVACFHVLEHVPSPVVTLGHLSKIARKFVLLAVPNGGRMPHLLRPSKNLYPVNEGHLQNWDHAHFLSLAERHCNLKLVGWGFDHVRLPILSEVVSRIFGRSACIALERGLFRRVFPFQSASVIGLFEVDGSGDGPGNTISGS